MLIECTVVFVWMLALYASIFSWRVRRTKNYTQECKSLFSAAMFCLLAVIAIERFSYFVLWYAVATTLALSLVICYGLMRSRTKEPSVLEALDNVS